MAHAKLISDQAMMLVNFAQKINNRYAAHSLILDIVYARRAG